MKRLLAFAFFLLFLAAIAFVNLKGIEHRRNALDAEPEPPRQTGESGAFDGASRARNETPVTA